MNNARQRTTRIVGAATGMALATAAFGASAGLASAAIGGPAAIGHCSTVAGTKTCHTTSSGETKFTVPAGVHVVRFDLVGAWGGDVGASRHGGKPLEIKASLNVAPGEVLFLYTGGAGGDGTSQHAGSGGFNGGGDGGRGRTNGAGGGGASDVRAAKDNLQNRRIVAAGGGGAGGNHDGGNHDVAAPGLFGGVSGHIPALGRYGLGADGDGGFQNSYGGGGGGGGYGGGGGGGSTNGNGYGGGGGSSFFRYKKYSVRGMTAPAGDAATTGGDGSISLSFKA